MAKKVKNGGLLVKASSIVFTALSLLFVQLAALAGDGGGRITRIYVHDAATPVVMFSVDQHMGPPACSGHEWAFEIDTDVGKAMYSALLSAASAGKSVEVKGTGTCSAWPDREKPYLVVVDYQK